MDINTNFIAGKMNKSVIERLIPQGQYIDALNVSLVSTETTDIGAVEYSKVYSILSIKPSVSSSYFSPKLALNWFIIYRDCINISISYRPSYNLRRNLELI